MTNELNALQLQDLSAFLCVVIRFVLPFDPRLHCVDTCSARALKTRPTRCRGEHVLRSCCRYDQPRNKSAFSRNVCFHQRELSRALTLVSATGLLGYTCEILPNHTRTERLLSSSAALKARASYLVYVLMRATFLGPRSVPVRQRWGPKHPQSTARTKISFLSDLVFILFTYIQF